MKNSKVTLVPLASENREKFILDNQWAFKYGAMQEFGQRDNHIDDDGEIKQYWGEQEQIYNMLRTGSYEREN